MKRFSIEWTDENGVIDQEDVDIHMRAHDFQRALKEFWEQSLRRRRKYTDEEAVSIEKLEAEFWDTMEACDVKRFL